MSGSVVLEGQEAADRGPVLEMTPEESPKSGPTPEEALAASQKAIEQSERARVEAQQREQTAQAELQRARASQQQDQTAVLASQVEASTAERDRHASAWQAAMEAGDFKAAADHNKNLALATARLERASGDLAVIRAGIERQQQSGTREPQQRSGVSAASMAWVNSHPEFNRHATALIERSNRIIAEGVVPDSPRYFRDLDAEYDRLTGAADDKPVQQRGQSMNDGNGRQQFDGGTPSRGGGQSGGGNTVKTLLGPVSVSKGSDGRIRSINIPSHLRELFDEGAKINGYFRDVGGKRVLDTAGYALEQIEIAQERAAGGTGSLITAEGQIFK